MATVRAQSILGPIYRIPPPRGASTCRICTTPIDLGHPYCYACTGHLETGKPLADRVIPLSWAPFGTQAYQDVYSYKLPGAGAAPLDRLQKLVAIVFGRHRQCIAPSVESTRYGIAHVPSTSGRVGTHPLERILDVFAVNIPRIQPRYRGDVGESRNLPRQLRPHLWDLDSSQLTNVDAVLLFDDSWATGGHAQSIASKIKAMGKPVAIVPLARVINTNWAPSQRYLAAHPFEPFDASVCPVHHVRHD